MRTPFKHVTSIISAIIAASASSMSAANVSVSVGSNFYTPATVSVNVGDTVTWNWAGGTHNVVSDDGFFSSGTPSGTPHSFSFQFNSSGDFPYYCTRHSVRVVDGGLIGVTQNGMVSVAAAANVPPTASISSPAANALFLYSPTNIAVQATASDSDGTVTSVEFLLDNVSKATLTAPPYNTSLTSVGPGSHTIKVTATDNSGAQTSSSISITVNNPPTASITAPANATVMATSSNITLTATGSDSDGSLSSLQIFVNDVALGSSSTTSPVSKTFTPTTNGVYTIKAVSTDNRGAVTTSSSVQLISTVINLSGFKVLNGKFQFSMSGLVPPKSFVLQGASSLATPVSWTSLQTNVAGSDTFLFSDTDSSSLNLRYYRVFELP